MIAWLGKHSLKHRPDAGIFFPKIPERYAAQDAYDALSQREKQVLRLVALGYTNQQIAAQLFLSVKTIEAYRARLMQKLQLKGRAALVRYALRKGLLDDQAGQQMHQAA